LAPFAISAAVAIAGGLAWVFGVERLEPVAWSGASESEPVSAGDVA